MMTGLLTTSRWIDRLNGVVGKVVSWLTLLMIVLGAWNAIARYLGRFTETSLASNAYLEAQWYLFSVVFLLGAAWTLREDAHVRVDVLYGRLGPRGKAWIDLIGTFLFLLPFCVFAIWASWDAVANSWTIGELSPDPGGLPRWPLKALIPVCFVLLIAQGFSEAIKRIATLVGHDVSASKETT